MRGAAVTPPPAPAAAAPAAAPRAAARATAVVSEPPRPRVVMSLVADMPWNPATRTICPRSSAAWIRAARTSTILAFVCTESVMIPACDPVSEIASCPRSRAAIATSAQEMRSPVESSMSSSRGSGRDATSRARPISSSVVRPIAETTPTTRAPASRAATRRPATRLILSGSPTDVPPNFITTVPRRGDASLRPASGTSACSETVIAGPLYGRARRATPSRAGRRARAPG